MVGRIFERGAYFVGTDYLSHLLWDKYIEFEYSQQEWSRLAQIYTRILQIPLQHLDRYSTSFKQIAHSRPLAELRTAEEAAAAATAEEEAKLSAESVGVPLLDAEISAATAAPDGIGNLDEEVDSGDSKELEEYLAVRENFYNAAKEWDSKIRDFEIAIRRPYFHVKPLDDAQLGNWHRYLDFIENEGVFDKILKLYERCLIACANYPEYWIRFVQRMFTEGKLELALNGLQRSTGIFVKRRPEIHLFAARFREQQGDAEGARVAFKILRNELVPGLLEVFVKQANFEHRQGNREAACSVFDAALQSEKLKEDSRALAVLYIQYARFLDQVLKCEDKAREVYMTALDHLPTSKVLWEAAIFFEATHVSRRENVQRVDALVEQASIPLRPDGSPGLLVADREEISSIYLEFVDLVGDIEAIKKAESRHKLLFPLRKNFLDSKKRSSVDVGGQDRAKIHKPYVITTVTPATAINNGQVQWTASAYAQLQSQGWQQSASQQPTLLVQPQQWTQSYATYGNYATYAPQPQAAVAQQPTVYAGYAQAYAPQEVIQTYTPVQPASNVQETVYRAPIPSPTAPQPAGATIYYGSYY
ncbi:hypothetical protein KC19_VG133400 [Ceratodon purpureus]|uniref:Pre-mRNA-processing factor 39 n=1 Tax=Ceratodon purpureus TaxID=3225 RepID=A0A8T0HPM9_CERPU|nr:hypothetical protein KC19_VG133400 [Ceratodon purpureus]